MKESIFNKYDFYLFLLILCTAAGMWGGALKPARVISIIFAIPLFLSLKKVKTKILKEMLLFFTVLTIWSFFSLLWTTNRALGISEWGNMILRILFFLEIIVFGFLSKNTLNTIFCGWSIAFIITAIIAVWELNTGNHLEITRYAEEDVSINLGNGNMLARQFSAATFYNYNAYVTYVCYCLPFLFSLAIKWTRGIKQLLALSSLVLVLYVFILNASRGGLIVFFVFGAFFSYYKLSKSKFSIKITFLVLLAVFVFIFVYFWDVISFYLEMKMEKGLSSSRFQIWACSWQALLETGFMGCGIGGITDALTKQHAAVALPHNFFVELLLEFGVIIFVWFIFLMLKVFRTGRKSKNSIIKFIRISSFLVFPFVTIIDSGYIQDVGFWAYLGTMLLLNVVCANNNITPPHTYDISRGF